MTTTNQKIKRFIATFGDKSVWQVDTFIEKLVKEVLESEEKKHLEEIRRLKSELEKTEVANLMRDTI